MQQAEGPGTMFRYDLRRDGRFLGLRGRPTGELFMEAFRSETDGSFEFTRYRAGVPPDVEAWFRLEARRRLPRPSHD